MGKLTQRTRRVAEFAEKTCEARIPLVTVNNLVLNRLGEEIDTEITEKIRTESVFSAFSAGLCELCVYFRIMNHRQRRAFAKPQATSS
jgi:hypothetical protein